MAKKKKKTVSKRSSTSTATALKSSKKNPKPSGTSKELSAKGTSSKPKSEPKGKKKAFKASKRTAEAIEESRLKRNARNRKQAALERQKRVQAEAMANENAELASCHPGGAKPVPRGTPVYTPTMKERTQVLTMSGMGLQPAQIRLLVINPNTNLPVALSTLQRHFHRELEAGPPHHINQVAQYLFECTKGNNAHAVSAQKYFLGCRGGWKEKSVIEVESKSGVLVAPAAVSPKAWVDMMNKAGEGKIEPGTEE